jgi:hypothetical protein
MVSADSAKMYATESVLACVYFAGRTTNLLARRPLGTVQVRQAPRLHLYAVRVLIGMNANYRAHNNLLHSVSSIIVAESPYGVFHLEMCPQAMGMLPPIIEKSLFLLSTN